MDVKSTADDEPGSFKEKVYYEFTQCDVVKRTDDKERILVIQKGLVEIHKRDYRNFSSDTYLINEKSIRVSNYFKSQYERISSLKNIYLGEVFLVFVNKWRNALDFNLNEDIVFEEIKEFTEKIIDKAKFNPFRNFIKNFNKIDNVLVYYKYRPYKAYF
jgi:hypothetical protein